MATKFVDLEALNLRTTADTSSLSNRIGILHLGQKVDVLEPDSTPGWLKIQAAIDSKTLSGVVKAEINGLNSLRDPVSDAREALVEQAIIEWLRFDQGQGKETDAPYYKFVGQMWSAIGLDLTGKDAGMPWGAPALSFMVRNAAKVFSRYGNFKFSANHFGFVHDAVVKRNAGDSDAPFFGFRLNERIPEIGDIVVRWGGISQKDYSDVERGHAFPMHTSVTVSVKADFVLSISGNASNSVNILRHEKTPSGYLANSGHVFMLLGNQA